MQLSPIKVKDLNPLKHKECEEFRKKIGAKRLFIAAEINGTWGFMERNLCIHDELAIVQELITSAAME